MTRNHALAALTILLAAVPAGARLAQTRAPATVASEKAPAAEPNSANVSVPTPPVITFADEPTEAQTEMVEWAVERYVSIGLQLPDLEIAYPVTCGGKAGRYLVGRARVELCRPNRKLVLHEFAHAWDDASDAVDRDAFLELRGVDEWYEHEHEHDQHVSGGEQLALVITWGLMHVDITAPESEYAGQPLDEQPRYLPGLDDSSPETLTELFVLLTGSDPLSPGAVVAGTGSSGGVHPEPGGPPAGEYLPATSGAVYNYSPLTSFRPAQP